MVSTHELENVLLVQVEEKDQHDSLHGSEPSWLEDEHEAQGNLRQNLNCGL
ncbi:unnamed protein product [Gulo gulo]|uniref:Uncharacterized protein n=1 Tax=Gulo gulo TaxID=48420 RepID=A0A9X9MDF8_GULGU|nr:unnamed protein product [Gulo gulo]